MKRRMENPLLYYQLYSLTRNRWKRQPLLYGVVAGSVALTYLLVFQLIANTKAGFIATLTLCLFLMCLSAPLMSYNLFSLEYEKQTWESLALTRLTAKEILWGKWGAALARVAGLTVLMLPILLVNADLEVHIPGFLVGTYHTLFEPTIKLYVFLCGVSLLFGWGVLIVSLGTWLSFKLRRTLTTASALYAGQVFALALLPMLYLTFSQGNIQTEYIGYIQSYWEGFAWWIASLFTARAIIYLNPFWAAYELNSIDSYFDFWPTSDYGQGLMYLGWGFAQGLFYLALALLFAGLTYRGLKYAWRK
jgi:hypothetical protein